MFFLFWSVNGLGRKLANFFCARKDCFVIILDRKERFLNKKSDSLKKLKNRHFPKGLVDGFCLKKLPVSTFGSFKRKKNLNFWI